MISEKEKRELHQVYWRIRQLLFMLELPKKDADEHVMDTIRILRQIALERGLKP